MSLDESIKLAVKQSAEVEFKVIRNDLLDTFKNIFENVKKAKHAPDDLLTEKQVSEVTGLSLPTLRIWRDKKTHIKYVKLGASVRYKYSEILDFVNKNTVMVTKGDVKHG